MFFGKKKPTETEFERAVLRAGIIARCYEIEDSKVNTTKDLQSYLELAFKELNVKPDSEQKKMALGSVACLLEESTFISELLDFVLANPKKSLPIDTIPKMCAVVESYVRKFQEENP